jgi:WD40 repeat protein/serine/threonine protein kinase
MNEIEILMNAPEDASEAEYRAYLDQACGDDKELRGRVENLLESDRKAEAFMGQPAVEEDLAGIALVPEKQPGALVGNYKLLQKIGEGGFGAVYMADQLRPVKRRVALKIIKLGMDTRQVVARFEVERQALAMMDHPNIAKVHDAGATATGRPYFVMELVRGITITRFCEEQQLDTEARLSLFMDVCSAIQHAHQKGIIHRDLKPSNVIVTLHDDKAVPKVIDFGVAKATQQDLTDKTLFTQFEQFIGTPAYMSPEQAQMSGLDIDTRSDIYALGVLLYELLTGTTPFDAKTLAKSGQDEIRRVIREEDPPKPSTRLTELQKRSLAHSEVHIPNSAIDQDLDWIVMKALEKDRTRRYETANGLAADIRRHLSNEPVEAAAPSTAYRMGKYVQRHRTMVSAVAAVGVILLVATLVSTGLFISEREAKVIAVNAEVETEKARAKADDERVAGEIRLADEHLAKGNDPMGLAMLTRVLREAPTHLHRVAGERLMSALRLREFVREPPVELPNLKFSEFSPDGSKLISASAYPEKAFRVYDSATGEPLGEPMPYTDHYAVIGRFRPNHSHQVLAVTLHENSRTARAQLWNWQTGQPIGDKVDLGKRRLVACFSADGERILFGGDGSQGAQVYDADEGTPVGEPLLFPGHAVVAGEFSPVRDVNGDRWAVVASILGGNTLVWNVDAAERSEPEEYYLPYTKRFKCARFDHAGKRVVVGADDGSVYVWSFTTGDLLELRHDDSTESAEFSPDDELILTASADSKAWVSDSVTGRLLVTIPHEDKLRTAHFSPNGQYLLTSCFDDQVRVWETASGQQIGPSYAHAAPMKARFSPDGRRIFTTRREFAAANHARIWKIEFVQPRSQQFRHQVGKLVQVGGGQVNCADFSPDGRLLVTTGRDEMVRLWNTLSGEPHQHASPWRHYMPTSAHFSSDGALVCSVASHGAQIRNAETGKLIQPLLGKTELAKGGIFSRERNADGNYQVVIASQATCTTQVWDAETGEAKSEPLKHEGAVVCVAYSPDEKFLVTGSRDHTARIWDLDRGHVKVLKHDDVVRSVSFDSSGNYVLTASADQTARIWNASTGEPTGEPLSHSGAVFLGVFSPDGKKVLTCSQDGTARLWDTLTSLPFGRELRHEEAIYTGTFSPDGQRIATASSDGSARVWDVDSGLPLTEPLRHNGEVGIVTFSPDGGRLVTCGTDATARLWEMPVFPESDIPTWVLDWAEAVGGIRLKSDGAAEVVSNSERRRIRNEVKARIGDDYFHKIAAWFYKEPRERTIDAFSEMTFEQYITNRLRENTIDSVREVLRIDGSNTDALVAMATLLHQTGSQTRNPAQLTRAGIYARQALATRSESESDPELQRLAIEHERATIPAIKALAELESRAQRLLDEGDQERARTLYQAAALGWILIQAEADRADQSASIEDRFPALRNFVDRAHPPKEIVPIGSAWKFRDGAEDPGANWMKSDYISSGWSAGKTPLGFGDPGVDGITKSPSITFYFRHDFDIVDPHQLTDAHRDLMLRVQCDDGARIFINGKEQQRINLPAGVMDGNTPAVEATGTENRWFIFKLDTDELQQGPNLLAAEVHQNNPESSDLRFNLELSSRVFLGDYLATLPDKEISDLIMLLSIALPNGDEPETRNRWLAALAKTTPSDQKSELRDYRLRVQALLGQSDNDTEEDRPASR